MRAEMSADQGKFARIQTERAIPRPPFECVALLLQGGGALGSYQAGVYEALAEADLQPDWIAGISIGAFNAAIIAGNPPEERLAKLYEFWTSISTSPWLDWAANMPFMKPRGDFARSVLNNVSAASTLLSGASGFFSVRCPSPWLNAAGTPEATSWYDTKALSSTLERLVDFDRINSQEIRFSVGAVNVRTGNFVYFDNTTHEIEAKHIMASGALPPGFAAVEIDGEYYWDGGLVSNTPLHWVLECGPRKDTLAFQVDLWNARGDLPRNLRDVETRKKEIQYSSRTRANTDEFKKVQQLRTALSTLLERLPNELRDSDEVKLLSTEADRKVRNIVQLIYRSRRYEGHSKDYEFSRLSMKEHWRAGYQDAMRTLRHPEILERPTNREGVLTFDLSRDGRE